jgi:hypothetical protein
MRNTASERLCVCAVYKAGLVFAGGGDYHGVGLDG